MYLYNLSNSPVLISEGPPSIYLDYPCLSAASFLLLWLLLGCMYVGAVLLVPPHLAPPGVVCALPCRAPQGTPGWKNYNSPRERNAFIPFGQVLAFQSVWVGASNGSPLPSARLCWR